MACIPAFAASTIFGTDDRVRVGDATASPYQAVCRLVITYQNGETGHGTGFLYAPNLVATAAHCLYDTAQQRGGQVKQVEILPALDGEQMPYGSVVADGSNSRLHYPAQWQENMDWRYDYGVIELDEPLNPEIQPLKLARPSDRSLYAMKISVVGYGSDETYMTMSSGRVAWAREYDLLYEIDVKHGQSGGPVINQYGYVVGITNYGAEEGLSYNSGARLQGEAYAFLNGLLEKRVEMECPGQRYGEIREAI